MHRFKAKIPEKVSPTPLVATLHPLQMKLPATALNRTTIKTGFKKHSVYVFDDLIYSVHVNSVCDFIACLIISFRVRFNWFILTHLSKKKEKNDGVVGIAVYTNCVWSPLHGTHPLTEWLHAANQTRISRRSLDA